MKRKQQAGSSRFGWIAAIVMVGALLAPGVLFAQGEISTGQIVGKVADDNGAALPGVTISAKDLSTGRARTATTDSTGRYRFPVIPSGVYELSASLSGFTDQKFDRVRVSIGESPSVDFRLRLSGGAESVTVTATSATIETTSASSTSAIAEDQISSLPLNGRNFTDLIKVTPQAVVTPDNAIHVGGRGIQNSFNIDGADSNSSFFGEQRGGTRPPFTFSQEAIKEFQVVRTTYSSQFGNAIGATINAITRSGGNEFAGDLFGYYRANNPESDAFYRDTYTTRPGYTGKFESKQYGFALGGPIVKDLAFFFVAADIQRKESPRDYGYINNSAAQTFFSNPDNAAFVARFIDMADETGTKIQTQDAESLLAKVDLTIGEAGILSIRDNYSKYKGENQTSSSFTTGQSNNGLEENSFNSAVLNLTNVLGGTASNELIAQYAKEKRPRTANSTDLPETQIGNNGDFYFGQNNFLPNDLIETRLQLADNFAFLVGDHALKAGFDYSSVNYDDYFFRYQAGYYRFASWNDFKSGKPNRYIQSFSDYDGRVKYDIDYYAGYMQDEWRSSPNLTLIGGVRYELQDNPNPTETNPKYEATGRIADDRNNWAPRLGFAWDVNGDGKSVIRGGSGVYYSINPSLLTANALLANGVRVKQVQIDALADMPIYPGTFGSIGSIRSVTPNLFVFEDGFENSQTWRSSIGWETEASAGWVFGAEAIYAHSTNLERRYDANLGAPNPARSTVDGRPSYSGSPKKSNDFNRIWEFRSDGEARYKALILSTRKSMTSKWSLVGSYTWSQSYDNDSNERNVSSAGSSSEDINDLMADWGPSDYDVEHNLVLSSLVELPMGFQVGVFYNVRSGLPYTLRDSADLNGDGNNTDRATWQNADGSWFHAGRNSEHGPAFQTTDLRLTWTRELFAGQRLELILDAFNLYHSGNRYTTDTTITASGKRIVSGHNADGTAIYKRVVFNRTGEPRQFQLGMRWVF